jgi:hypothetical protein
METCHDCGTNLDRVALGSPCPSCGSIRRDATVRPETVAAVASVPAPSISVSHVDEDGSVVTVVGQAVDLTVTMGVEAFLASGTVTVDPVLDQTAAAHFEFRQSYYPPDGAEADGVLQRAHLRLDAAFRPSYLSSPQAFDPIGHDAGSH